MNFNETRHQNEIRSPIKAISVHFKRDILFFIVGYGWEGIAPCDGIAARGALYSPFWPTFICTTFWWNGSRIRWSLTALGMHICASTRTTLSVPSRKMQTPVGSTRPSPNVWGNTVWKWLRKRPILSNSAGMVVRPMELSSSWVSSFVGRSPSKRVNLM